MTAPIILVTSDKTGVFNAYRFSFNGKEKEALTDSKTNAIFGVSWFPKDNRLLYTSDTGGNEINHLYVRKTNGKVKVLTPGEKTKASFLEWSQNNKHFWVVTNERDPKAFDLYRYNVKGFKRKLIFKNKDNWQIDGVSRNGRWVVLSKLNSNADSDLYLWNAKKPRNKPVLITPHEGDGVHRTLTFTPDSKRLFYATDSHSEYMQAWSYDLKTKEHKSEITAEWDVLFVKFSKKGRYRVTGINQDAVTAVTLLDTTTNKEVPLPIEDEGEIRQVNFSPDETRLAFYLNADTSPADLHVYDFFEGKVKRLTKALNPSIKKTHLVEGKVVRYKSFDQLEIPAILYRPWSATPEKKVPALVLVHGGPGGQSRRGYRAEVQHLVNHGFAVLAVNNRGSSGYGKTFYHMDDRKHGDVDLKDCIYGRKYLESLPWVEGKRVGIIGGSYGGFIVAAALAFQPDSFEVGIDIFGVTNWVRSLSNMPPWWESFKQALYAEMGDPATDGERHRKISPLFHAKNINKPLLVVQGKNDPRVVQVESDELVEAVRKNGVPVEYVLFEDEGHGFRKRENRIAASDAYVKFLSEYL